MTRLLRRRDERGMALITVIMLTMIATLFVTTTMYVAFHDQTSSARNRSWGQALHVAESGVHEAIAYLQSTSGVVPSGTQTGTTTEGTYQYRIVAQPPPKRLKSKPYSPTESSGGVAPSGGGTWS